MGRIVSSRYVPRVYGMRRLQPKSERVGHEVSDERVPDVLRCTNFNGDITGWNGLGCRVLGGIFYNAESFDQDLSSWDVFRMWSFDQAFYGTDSFKGTGPENWDVSSAYSRHPCFQIRRLTRTYLIGDVSQVTSLDKTFYKATAFDGDISKWKTSKVKNMRSFFRGCATCVSDLSEWDTPGDLAGLRF